MIMASTTRPMYLKVLMRIGFGWYLKVTNSDLLYFRTNPILKFDLVNDVSYDIVLNS